MADQKKGNLTTAESKTEQFKIHPHRMCVYTVPRTGWKTSSAFKALSASLVLRKLRHCVLRGISPSTCKVFVK